MVGMRQVDSETWSTGMFELSEYRGVKRRRTDGDNDILLLR